MRVDKSDFGAVDSTVSLLQSCYLKRFSLRSLGVLGSDPQGYLRYAPRALQYTRCSRLWLEERDPEQLKGEGG